MFSWRRPDDLGIRGGTLARCKRSPNCVSSQVDPSDYAHYIPPIALRGEFSRVRSAVESMAGATVIEEKSDYLYAEFRSRLLGFVDDFELQLKDGVVHVRSASRLGRRDFGVNRKRVEALRRLLS